MLTYALIALVVLALLLGLAAYLAIYHQRLFVRGIFRPILASLYRGRAVGLEHLPPTGGVVVVSNHVSYIDGILILWLLPRNVRFLVDGDNFQSKILDYLAETFQTILMGRGVKSKVRALQTANTAVAAGDVVGVFPEGTLTRSGHLQGFERGVTKITKGTSAVFVPMHLHGMWGSLFSYSGGRLFKKWPQLFGHGGFLRRPVTLTLGAPLPAETPLGILRGKVAALGAAAAIEHRDQYELPAIRAVRAWRAKGSRLQAADTTGAEVGGRELLIRTLVLRRLLRREVFGSDERHVGVLLPPSVGAVATNVALALDRRVVVNLNYTATSEVVNHCLADVGVRHVLTSDKFLSKIDLQIDCPTVSLDSLRDKVTSADKVIAAAMATIVPLFLLRRILGLHRVSPDDLLTVVFTSGSTGMPKGVQLSQSNVSHNIDAIGKAVRLDEHDVVIGVLPFFHSFGYAVTLWASQTLGPAGVYHFNPLDARSVGKLAEKYGGTVLLGTPTFLRGYIRRITPEQFAKLDVVVVGAEKMPADLFEEFEQRFGVRPIEGYGTTELSPLVSVNIPPTRSVAVFQKDRVEGSVGRPVPGVAVRIDSTDDGSDVTGVADGMLMVLGPNVMLGYFGRDDLTAGVKTGGWYKTGDIANVDDGGFIHITGRLSRFSKIGGEMVPHVRVEEELTRALDAIDPGTIDADGDGRADLRLAVTAVPDEKKGERLIVLHTATAATADQLREAIRKAGLPNLYVPAADAFVEVAAIPMLGTGKLDLKAAKELAGRGGAG